MGANPASTSEARFVAHWAQARPDAPAIIDDQESVSFAELDRRVAGLGSVPAEGGMTP